MEVERAELLVRLLSRHQEELFRYIFALLPHEEDARDVLQETSVALCRKFADYDPAKPFLAWAYRFAYLEILKQRERNRRGTRHLTRELIERLAREREDYEPMLQIRLQALEQCLEDLPGPDRELIRQRYQGNEPADAFSQARSYPPLALELYQPPRGRDGIVLSTILAKQPGLESHLCKPTGDSNRPGRLDRRPAGSPARFDLCYKRDEGHQRCFPYPYLEPERLARKRAVR